MSNIYATKANLVATRLRESAEAVTAVENTIRTRALASDLRVQASTFQSLAEKAIGAVGLSATARSSALDRLTEAYSAFNSLYWDTNRTDIEQFATSKQDEVEAFRRKLEDEVALTSDEKDQIVAAARAFGLS